MNKYCITTELLHFYFEMLQFFCIFCNMFGKMCVNLFQKSIYFVKGMGICSAQRLNEILFKGSSLSDKNTTFLFFILSSQPRKIQRTTSKCVISKRRSRSPGSCYTCPSHKLLSASLVATLILLYARQSTLLLYTCPADAYILLCLYSTLTYTQAIPFRKKTYTQAKYMSNRWTIPSTVARKIK
jgi:hypothetical protein